MNNNLICINLKSMIFFDYIIVELNTNDLSVDQMISKCRKYVIACNIHGIQLEKRKNSPFIVTIEIEVALEPSTNHRKPRLTKCTHKCYD